MKMNQGKKMLFVCLSILLTASVNAQMAKDEVQLVQNIWGLEKRAIVSDYMKFTEVELTKFLPIYDKYVEEGKKLSEERIQIIASYADNYVGLTNEKADELTQRLLKNNAAIDKLQLKYYNLIKKEISAIRAAQFMQLELYMQTMIRAELQNSLPMIGELDKLDK
jgi:hypothetical protein